MWAGILPRRVHDPYVTGKDSDELTVFRTSNVGQLNGLLVIVRPDDLNIGKLIFLIGEHNCVLDHNFLLSELPASLNADSPVSLFPRFLTSIEVYDHRRTKTPSTDGLGDLLILTAAYSSTDIAMLLLLKMITIRPVAPTSPAGPVGLIWVERLGPLIKA
jgi:hypothetical protein